MFDRRSLDWSIEPGAFGVYMEPIEVRHERQKHQLCFQASASVIHNDGIGNRIRFRRLQLVASDQSPPFSGAYPVSWGKHGEYNQSRNKSSDSQLPIKGVKFFRHLPDAISADATAPAKAYQVKLWKCGDAIVADDEMITRMNETVETMASAQPST